GVASTATSATLPRAHRARAPADSNSRHAGQADWRRHARRCTPSNRSGKSPRCSVRPRLWATWFHDSWRGRIIAAWHLQYPRLAPFQWSPLDQRIRPPPQRGNVNIDPILPPIKARSIVAKRFPLFRNQCLSQFFHIVRYEIVLVLKNKGLKQL